MLPFITDEIKTEAGLTDEQIAKLAPAYESHIATEKQAWDGVANKNAEKIIDGALAKVLETTKIARLDGEKAADYIARAGAESVSAQKSEVEQLKSDYATKLKEFKGDEATKEELAESKKKLDDALIKLADFDKLKETAEKYEPLQGQYNSLKETVTFQSVKPPLPEGVNQYEFNAKWDAFVSDTKSKYNVEYVDNVAIAIDKENPHKQVKLADLLKTDKDLTTLLEGRQQNGTGARAQGQVKVADVPFTLPENATSEQISQAINEYLDKEGIAKLAPERTGKFAELFSKIKAGVSK
jgi:hypothetical protein